MVKYHGYHCDLLGGFWHLDKYTDASFTHGSFSSSSLVFDLTIRLQEAEICPQSRRFLEPEQLASLF